MTRAALRPITAAEKLAAVRRELRMRERVYPRLVAKGKLSHDTAAYEIAVMRAIEEDYEAEAEKERLL